MKTCRFSTLMVSMLLGLSLRGVAAEPARESLGDAPLVDPKVRQAMQDRQYPQALKAIAEASAAKGAPRDYLAYLKGWALCLSKQYDAAAAAFDQVEKDFPKSRWVRKARFAKGMALARKGDFRGAEVIFRGEAEFLLSAERRQELAAIYLEFADHYFKPAKEDEKPDYQKAMDCYRQALDVGPSPERRLEVELLVAECAQRLNRLGEAAGMYATFSQDHPESPLDVEARYRLGECRLAEKNDAEARRVWQDLLAKHVDAKSDRLPEAAFHLAETWGVPQPSTDEDLSLGVAALESFVERYPAHKLASPAHLEIAQSYLARGRQEDAVASLTRFLKDPRYQDRKEVPEAWNLLGGAYRAQKKFAEALSTWREFLTKYPTHEAWSSVQREIVSTEYLVGLEQYKARQYDAAVKTLSAFLARYPLDGRGPGILFLFGQIEAEQKHWDAAIAAWRRLTAKYPGTEEAWQAQFRIAQTIELELGRLEDSLEEYRKVTGGRMADQARQRIARLTAVTMTVATERIFRSDETPRLKLTTRNIESLTVRVYQVDLETYFRKMHRIRGVERLDIGLIDPDRTFEFQVPGFVKYQELERYVDVPLPEGLRAGVTAVTVSSKALEATTMVIQSDLDVIVKSSRDEVFVFAENMLTGKPWPGVKLVVSDGEQVVAEETTDPQGICRRTLKDVKDASSIRVFALVQGNVASSEAAIQGAAGQRAADRGYLYTDMPVYSIGATVHVRGCIRQFADDAYMFVKDRAYTLEVFDSRNRSVYREPVKLSGVGTFALQFALPATSPQGEYRIVARDQDGHNYQGRFRVHQAAPELIRLAVDAPRKVFYRGETIEGVVRASYYYGVPLVGREVRYQLGAGAVSTAKTDEHGEVRFKLPTREFNETQTIAMVVTLADQNVQTSANFFLATQAFSLGVSTMRPVFIAGEPLEASVRAIDAEGKPVAEKLMLRVLEVTTAGGQVGERQIAEYPVATAADGWVRQTVKLDKGGRFILRAEGTDRFKNAISGETSVQISDDEDRERLRILADRHSFRAGDTADVLIHWREPAALALVTFEGSQVLDHRLVELKTGVNKLTIPMTARLGPNFQLAVAVMSDSRPAAMFAAGLPTATKAVPLGADRGARVSRPRRRRRPEVSRRDQETFGQVPWHGRETVPQQVETVPQQVETVPQQGETVPQQGETVPQQVETVPQRTDPRHDASTKRQRSSSWNGT